MITVNANYTNLRNAGANIEWQILNGSNTFTKANLITGKISSGLMENVSIGNCISAELDLELWGVTVDSSNPLVVQFRATQVGTTLPTTWFTKGTFYIDTLEKNPYNENTTVTAFDAMLKTEVGYMASGVWANPTDEDVVDDIATDLGVTVESATATALNTNPITLSNAPHIGENGTTDREMLSYIAMLRGGNWVITSANELKLIYPSTTPTNTAQVDKAVVNFAASETLTVSKVKVNVDSETYYLAPSNITEDAWKALAGYCIEITLPFYGTQTVADDLLTQYDTKTFIPFQAEGAYVDPKYEVGDGVRFQKDSTYYTSVIANQTIDISWLCPSDLYLKDEEKLQSLYPYLSPRERQTLYQFGELEDAVDSAQSAANAAQASADGANYREQIIYISKASGTLSVNPNTTWVTDATGDQNTWTTTRPVYSSSYPVLFVATQRQSVSQSSGTTCTCTTPVKDQTTTVIDGGHITTGTIDASQVNVTNINASNINSGTLSAITISGNTISGNTITGGTISGTTITGSTLTSATASGSVQIANGNINFFKNATTTGTPFSQMKHIYDSGQGDSIEWTNSGYTKMVNTGGGQWTANFVQFALDASNPKMQMQIYSDSDGTHSKILSNWVDILGTVTGQRLGDTSDYDRFVVALCKSYNGASDSWWTGRIIHDRTNGVIPPWYADVMAHNRYQSGAGWVDLVTNYRSFAGSKTGTYEGWQPCTFVYNNETYAGIEGYFLQSGVIYASGRGSFTPFAIRYYDTNGGGVLNSEIYNSISFTGTSSFGAHKTRAILTGINGSNTISGAYANYDSFIVRGIPASSVYSTCFIPKIAITTSDTSWQLADELYYVKFNIRYSGNDLIIGNVASNNGTKYIDLYGILL